MRCLYCGKELALFKRLRGGEFCSDAHRLRYQEEYTQLALNRLMQANSAKESHEPDVPNELESSQPDVAQKVLQQKALQKPNADRDAKTPIRKSAEPIESPAMKRREKLRTEELPELAPAASIGTAPVMEEEFATAAVAAGPSEVLESRQVSVVITAEPTSPPFAGLLAELPSPVYCEVLDFCKPDLEFSFTGETARPPARNGNAPTLEREMTIAPPVESVLASGLDWSAPKQRGIDVRDYVRSVPVVEIDLHPVTEMDFPYFNEPLEIILTSHAPEASVVLYQEGMREFLPPTAEFQEMARLDFEPTPWGEDADLETVTDTEDSAPDQAPASLESSRMEPMRVEPVHFEGAAPQPFQFAPVHIDPVFMERVAVKSDLADDIQQEPEPEPEPEPQEAYPTPEAVTRPEPVTLHGIAPTRGKPMQIFSSSLPRAVEIQTPLQSALPLRSVMVFGPALPVADTKPALAPEKAAAEKQESKPSNGKRKPEVRVLSVPVKVESKPIQVKLAEPKIAEPLPVEAKGTNGNSKGAESNPVEPKPVATKKNGLEKEIKKEDVRKPVEPVAALKQPVEPAPAAEAYHHPAPLSPASPIPDLLNIPKISLEKESFWSRIPVFLRIGIIAGVLAAVAGGIFLTSHGSGASLPGPKQDRVVVEAGPALVTNAGWAQDWFTDPRGSKLARHVDILKDSLTLRDYRLELEGQIDHSAIGWTFRANNKNFYAEKVAIVKPGLDPTIALIRIAVVDGQEVVREQVPLPLKVHLDTLYKIRMDAVGHRFTTWVQGQQVDNWVDNRIDAGGVGLYYDAGDSAHLKGTLTVVPLKEK